MEKTKPYFYTLIAAGSIAFAILSTDRAIADEHCGEPVVAIDVVDVDVAMYDTDYDAVTQAVPVVIATPVKTVEFEDCND